MKKQSMMGSSKYEFEGNIDIDIAETKNKINQFKHELSILIDECYNKHCYDFSNYRTAIDILREILAQKYKEYGKQL